MARRKAKKHDPDKLYLLVERLHSNPKPTSKQKQSYNFNDPTALRALRIHRHLRALENDILQDKEKKKITISMDRENGRIVLCIENDEVHCSRIAYLTRKEFAFLRRNRRVANVLRKCPAWKDVA